MYKIIGADGKEYGPVTLEQLRQWMADGRANAQTQVQLEGATDWKLLGELTEFASSSGNVPPPVNAPVNPEAFATQILAHDYTIQIGSCVGRGWALVKSNFWLLVCVSFVGTLIASASIIGLILGGPMIGGLYAMYLKKIRGQPATFGDAFVGFSLFLPLMLAHIVSALLTGVGFILCLIPGIYLAVSWVFTLALVIDKRLDFWPAMELSRKVVTKHWWLIFGLLIVNGLICLLGVLCCVIGVFVALPVMFASMMYAYEDIFGTNPATTP